MMSTAEIRVANMAEQRANERRRDPRYTFTGEIEIVDLQSGIKVTAHTSDLSRGGCYVDMFSPLPKDVTVQIRLTKWRMTLEAQARVVYSSIGMGMGLMFGSLDLGQEALVENWLTHLKEVQPC
jgi:PilZ domain